MMFRVILSCLEVLSFILWIIFTICSIALAGLGLEGILFAAFLVAVSSTQPIYFPVRIFLEGSIGIFLSIFWRQVGIDHLHYLVYDSPNFVNGDEEGPSQVLQDLIREVDESTGYARNDARVKAKAWLMDHGSSLEKEDILLAKDHFGYMLPPGWGQGTDK